MAATSFSAKEAQPATRGTAARNRASTVPRCKQHAYCPSDDQCTDEQISATPFESSCAEVSAVDAINNAAALIVFIRVEVNYIRTGYVVVIIIAVFVAVAVIVVIIIILAKLWRRIYRLFTSCELNNFLLVGR